MPCRRWKVSDAGRLVPPISCYPTEEQKLKGKNVSSHMLERYAVEGDEFLYSILKGDESRFY